MRSAASVTKLSFRTLGRSWKSGVSVHEGTHKSVGVKVVLSRSDLKFTDAFYVFSIRRFALI